MTRLPRVRGVSGEKGATLLEFAFVSILFMMLTAAREGCRYAIVNGGDSGHAVTAQQVSDYVMTRIPFGGAVVSTTWADATKTPGTIVTVKVDFAFSPVISFFPDIPLTSTSKMVISY
jgi:hypothetical protein